MWRIIYNGIVFPTIQLAAQIISLQNPKFRRAIRGRRGWKERLRTAVGQFRSRSPVIWIHAASMGEFEHAKPIISELKSRFPKSSLVLTFFSPSAHDHVSSYPGVNIIEYLPLDSRKEVTRFYEILKPTIGLIVKHDTWPNLCWLAHDRNIPLFLVDASLPKNSNRLRISAFSRSVYRSFREILSVSPDDAIRFERITHDKSKIKVMGDTRYDQVFSRSQKAKEETIIPAKILKGKTVAIIGSDWPEDDQHLLPVLKQLFNSRNNLLAILVPHEIEERQYQSIEHELVDVIRLSNILQYQGQRVILVDRIGVLAGLYSIGHLAFVGGAFSTGVHSVMEPAVFGLPVFTGPKIENSHEAGELVTRGGAFVIRSSGELLESWTKLLSNETHRLQAGKRSSDFVRQNLGATRWLVDHLEPFNQKEL